ncbi:MAG: DMT family transporter [Gammaproteobacteria bacterium]
MVKTQLSAGADGHRAHFPWRGFGLGLGAAFCLSSQDAAIKFLSGDYHIMQIIFARAALGALLGVALLARADGAALLRPQKPALAAARVVCALAANLCYYIALARLDLAVYTCLGLTVFVFAAALSGPLLGEKSSWTDWLAVAAGLAGVAVVTAPSADSPIDLPAALLLLFGALMWALSITITRALGASLSSLGILFYSSAALASLSLAFLPEVWRAPDGRDAALFLLLGVLGAVGQWLSISAYRNARMGAVIPTQHTMLLWAAFYAWILWGTPPTLRLCIGGGLIIFAGLISLPKPKRRKKRAK